MPLPHCCYMVLRLYSTSQNHDQPLQLLAGGLPVTPISSLPLGLLSWGASSDGHTGLLEENLFFFSFLNCF